MTFDQWLVVFVIFATLIGPTIGVLLQHRLSKEKPPSPSWIKRALWWLGKKATYALWIGIAFDVLLLVRELTSSDAFTKLTAVVISILVAGIFTNLTLLVLSGFLDTIVTAINRILDREKTGLKGELRRMDELEAAFEASRSNKRKREKARKQ